MVRNSEMPHYHLAIDHELSAYGRNWLTFSNDHMLVRINYHH